MNGADMKPTHEFDPGYTGMSKECNRLVVDSDGSGVECGLPRELHALGGARRDHSAALPARRWGAVTPSGDHVRGCQATQGVALPCSCHEGVVDGIAGDAPCVECGRDNRNGTHRAFEALGHLSHPYTSEVPPLPAPEPTP